MNFLAKCGVVSVGDTVVFVTSSGLNKGKIIGAEPDNCVKVYVSDYSGGYSVLCNLNQILEKLKPEESEAEEDISKPQRYNKVGKLECWDVILDQEMDFLEGNALKYLWRHKQKNGPQDLKKAIEYLNKMIKDYDKIYKKDS